MLALTLQSVCGPSVLYHSCETIHAGYFAPVVTLFWHFGAYQKSLITDFALNLLRCLCHYLET